MKGSSNSLTKKVNELVTSYINRIWSLDDFQEQMQFKLTYLKKNKQECFYNYPDKFEFVMLNEIHLHSDSDLEVYIGLKRHENDYQKGKIKNILSGMLDQGYWGARHPIHRDDYTSLISFRVEKSINIDNFQSTILNDSSQSDYDDLMNPNEDDDFVKTYYSKFWLFPDRILLLSQIPIAIAKKLGINVIEINSAFKDNHSIYKRLFEFINNSPNINGFNINLNRVWEEYN
jgi:hypothetical protein